MKNLSDALSQIEITDLGAILPQKARVRSACSHAEAAWIATR